MSNSTDKIAKTYRKSIQTRDFKKEFCQKKQRYQKQAFPDTYSLMKSSNRTSTSLSPLLLIQKFVVVLVEIISNKRFVCRSASSNWSFPPFRSLNSC